jgi:hypothetical protein
VHLITDDYFIDSVLADAELTRTVFCDHKLALITKYQGELADALLHARTGNTPWKQVWDSAVRVATLALHIATQGDTLAKPNHVNTRGME